MKITAQETDIIRETRVRTSQRKQRLDNKLHSRALNHAEWLVKLTSGADREVAVELRNRIMLPMNVVVAELPGLTMSSKAANAEVSRQTLYDWINGKVRPSPKQAKKLAELTKIAADKIMGRTR